MLCVAVAQVSGAPWTSYRNPKLFKGFHLTWNRYLLGHQWFANFVIYCAWWTYNESWSSFQCAIWFRILFWGTFDVYQQAVTYQNVFGEAGNSGNSTNTGVIAGAVVGGTVLLFAVLALVLYYLCIYKPKKQQKFADAFFIKSGGNHSGSASDLLNMHSCQYS